LKITTSFWHFARGSAYVASKQTANAEAELTAMRALDRAMTDEVRLFNNAAAHVLKVGELELEGKIALARGNKQAGIDLLHKAAAAEDATDYAEPSDWDLPVREVLGAVLLLAGDNSGAEKVFRAELERHHRSGRALFGLAESLKRQGKDAAARSVQGEFEKAWQYADTKLTVESLAGVAISAAGASSTTAQVRFSSVNADTAIRIVRREVTR